MYSTSHSIFPLCPSKPLCSLPFLYLSLLLLPVALSLPALLFFVPPSLVLFATEPVDENRNVFFDDGPELRRWERGVDTHTHTLSWYIGLCPPSISGFFMQVPTLAH